MIKDDYQYNSVDVACLIVEAANNHKLVINMTKLQKLLYIVYGTYLACEGKRLTDEHPQAWPYGPVFPTVRNKLLKKDFANLKASEAIKQDKDLEYYVESVLAFFGDKTASTLVVWSHQPDSPWDRTTKRDRFKWGMAIPDDYIMSYFKSIVKDGAKTATV